MVRCALLLWNTPTYVSVSGIEDLTYLSHDGGILIISAHARSRPYDKYHWLAFVVSGSTSS